MQKFDFERVLSSRVKRRQVLIGTGALTGLAIASQWSNKVIAQPRFSAYPFSLGVASGEPLANGVVLWTRLAPDPLNGGGMPGYNVPVQWQVSDDENMRRIIRSGTEIATPQLGHSVHVEVEGLRPAQWYWYQFRVGDEVSPIGRTRTAPGFGYRIDRFRFAFASCQNWQSGYYTAYKYMAQEDLDLVVHLGDYIYEGAPTPSAVRQHDGNGEPTTVEGYRNRYALYKSDQNLQAAHAAFPWITTWDDHEVDNNYAGDVPQDPALQSREAFLARRAAAYQVYYEHLPLRRFSLPTGADMQLYRRLTFGNLAEFNVLDTRQYRSDQACGDGTRINCTEALESSRTITGQKQEQWLFQGLAKSQARWNILAQQVFMAQRDFEPGAEVRLSMDAWDGYAASRDRLFQFLQQRQPANPVVLTGDVHANWVADLKADFNNPTSKTIGTEFVGTSISTGGDGSDTNANTEAILAENPHIKFFNNQRGYVRCELTPQRWQSDYRTVAAVTILDAPITTRASFVVENGRPGAQRL
ncbi:MAG: alkaline phosphatase [Tatlockia sp.]|nr:alkaline phosphatase [Tatlockia sp.]